MLYKQESCRGVWSKGGTEGKCFCSVGGKGGQGLWSQPCAEALCRKKKDDKNKEAKRDKAPKKEQKDEKHHKNR